MLKHIGMTAISCVLLAMTAACAGLEGDAMGDAEAAMGDADAPSEAESGAVQDADADVSEDTEDNSADVATAKQELRQMTWRYIIKNAKVCTPNASSCTRYDDYVSALHKVGSIGMPYNFRDTCLTGDGDIYCRPGQLSQLSFDFWNGSAGWSWNSPQWFKSDIGQGWATQINPSGQPGGIPSFSCVQISETIWRCIAGTGGPGWSWVLTAYYEAW